ncbi:MAG: ATP-binding cassette domain-containing protein [Spirochaeta sp.]|nr:ATP-binding cassette domain-containing protein [Spirochaeta sp.]
MTTALNQEEVPLIKMESISKHFPGVTANDRVDLELYSGQVLALLGENGAGKSSLMNVLAGLYRPDGGEIFIRGKRVQINSPRDASNLGIGMVHQNFKLVDTMTVAENIILGMTGLPFILRLEQVKQEISLLSARYNLQVDPDSYIWQLSVGEQQRVEILKLIYRGAEILILDEPTAVLTPQEALELNQVIRRMRSEGKAVIFITHKMEEVISFSDCVRVLNRGRLAAVKKTAETNPRELARLMVGREVLFHLEKEPPDYGEKKLEVIEVRAADDRGLPALCGVSFSIRSGEILGIAGVAGNGQRQLAEVVTGLRKVTGGKIIINNKDKTNSKPIAFITSGVSHIPADRMLMGVVGDMSVAYNLAMKGYRSPPLTSFGLLKPGRIMDFARRLIDLFRITTPTPNTFIKFLSGGNIQKAILAREIESCGALLVAVYPSRGLDVGAAEAVRKRLLEQRQAGTAVLLISEHLEELLSLADNIGVLFEGRISGMLPADQADSETLGALMTGIKVEGLN